MTRLRSRKGPVSSSKTAIKGNRAMPAKGGQSGLSDMEVARAVVFMANAGGGKFKEPKTVEVVEALK